MAPARSAPHLIAVEFSSYWADENRRGTPHAVIRTFDCNGDPVDAAFTFVVYLADYGL